MLLLGETLSLEQARLRLRTRAEVVYALLAAFLWRVSRLSVSHLAMYVVAMDPQACTLELPYRL